MNERYLLVEDGGSGVAGTDYGEGEKRLTTADISSARLREAE